ncbi:hypothetical protein KCU64_g12397, partial [Aureobasidium melanogenum]
MLLTGTGKPRVILGTMTFGPDTDSGARQTDLADYNKALDYLQSQGYNEIDTARTYGWKAGGLDQGCSLEGTWPDFGYKVLPPRAR